MKDYLVASLKATPANPTFTEARDALLAVAVANDPADALLFCQAFAKRGIGQGAVSPDRFSTAHEGVVESYLCGGQLSIQEVSIASTGAGCEADTFVDSGESAILTLVIRNIGGVALSDTTAAITSSHPGVNIGNGGNITIGPLNAFESVSSGIQVSIDPGLTGIQVYDFNITVSDPAAVATIGPETFNFAGNIDETPQNSATDTVESADSLWNSDGGPGTWERVQGDSVLDYHWLGPDSDELSDHYLVSPSLNVASTGDFTFSFDHRFSFEAAEPTNFDGGVLELSTDGGATWSDIGESATPTYNGTITDVSGNPLANRLGYVQTNAGYPDFVTVSVNLGAAYQGADRENSISDRHGPGSRRCRLGDRQHNL